MSDQAGTPRTTIDAESVAKIFTDVLECDQLDVDADFFEAGGNSMTATLTTYRLRDEFEVEVPLLLIFEHSTATELAQAIEGLRDEEN